MLIHLLRRTPRYIKLCNDFTIDSLIFPCQVLSCTNVGTCDVYECAVPSGIDKDIASILNINFSLDKTKAEASETEDTYKVITSLCTMGHDR